MEVELPDGTVITDIPDGITKAQLAQKLQSGGYKVPPEWLGTPSQDAMGARPRLPQVEELTMAERVASGLVGKGEGFSQPLVDFAAGASSTMRGAANLLSGDRKLGDTIWPTSPAGEGVARTAGEILDPAALAIGGAAFKGAQGIKALAGTSLPKIAAQGVVGGAGAGAAISGLNEGDVGLGAAIGGAAGGAIPIIGKGITTAYRPIAEMFSKSAREKAAGRTFLEASDGQSDKVIAALEQSSPIVSKQTAGQAATSAGVPTFSALQDVVDRLSPNKFYQNKLMAQRQARSDEIGSFAKTEQELRDAITARDTVAKQNYKKAFETVIKSDAELQKIVANPYMKDVIPEVEKLAQAAGGMTPTEKLHVAKKQLDKILQGTPDNKPSDAETRAITDLQNKLTAWLTDRNNAYKIARSEYEKASKPIGEMEIGQLAQKILRSGVGDKERATPFVNQLDDEIKLLRKSTGFTKTQLSDQLSPENLAKLNKVAKELDIDARFTEQAMIGRDAIGRQLGVKFEIPNMLNTAVTLTNGVLRRIQGQASEKTLKEMADYMQDPAKVAQMMKNATKAEQNAIKWLQRARMAGAISSTQVKEQQ